MPPATAGPSTAAMTGFDSSRRDGPKGPRGALPPSLGKSRARTGSWRSRSETVLRSQPAQKAPPSPQNTATLAESSASNASKAATRASALLGSMALRASGRLWMTVQTEPDFSMRTAMTFLLADGDFAGERPNLARHGARVTIQVAAHTVICPNGKREKNRSDADRVRQPVLRRMTAPQMWRFKADPAHG